MNVRIATCLVLAAFAVPALADEVPESTQTAATTAGTPAMSAEDQAMMAAWEKASTPGKEHATLAQLEGPFDAAVSMWMKPGAPVEKSTGRAENRMIYGGRHLEGRFNGTFMGQPFEGLSYTGYDNIQKKYYSSWIDSMATTMMMSTGTADAGGKTMTFTGECHDPMTGKPAPFKNLMTIDGPNRYSLQMWSTDAKTGETWKTMEIVYTRTGTAQNAD